jgi:recombination protein RecT
MTSTEIVKRPVVQLIKDSASEFAKRLPAKADATKWMMQLATAVQKSPDLLNCEPASLLLAAYEAAELGVSLSPTLQLGYLIPYGKTAQFQISWRGLVQRAYETGTVRSFYAEMVYQNDKFERQYAPKRNLFHSPGEGDRGEEIGAYALVEFKDETIDWEFADKALIERHRKHSRQPDSLMWSKFREEAWKKTAIRILAKRLPLSNPGMEAWADVIERDANLELEPEAAGRLELEPDSPMLVPENPTSRLPSLMPAGRKSLGNRADARTRAKCGGICRDRAGHDDRFRPDDPPEGRSTESRWAVGQGGGRLDNARGPDARALGYVRAEENSGGRSWRQRTKRRGVVLGKGSFGGIRAGCSPA